MAPSKDGYESESEISTECDSESNSTSSSVDTDESVDEDNVGHIRPHNFEPRLGANKMIFDEAAARRRKPST